MQSVNLSFYALRSSQGSQNLQLYYGTSAAGLPGTLSSTYTVGTNYPGSAYTASINGGLNPNGLTYFRLYPYNAGQNTNGHFIYLDDVTFTGCGVPTAPTLAKVFSPGIIAAGGTTTLTFTLSNPNSGLALTGAAFNDTLPAGMTVASTPGASTTCAGATWNPSAGANALSFSGGTIPAGGSCTAQVNVTTSALGSSTNVSDSISTTQTGANTGSGGAAAATLTVVAPPQIGKRFLANPILAGDISILTFTITNPNPNNAISGVTFTDTFPTSPGAMVVANPSNASNSCGGTFTATAGAGSVSLINASINAGSSCTISVNITAPAVGDYANTSGTISHLVNAAISNGNTTSDTLTVNPANPGIAFLKQVGLTNDVNEAWFPYLAVAPGTPVYYLFTIENTGDVPLSSISLSDPDISTAGCTLPNPLPVPSAFNENHIVTCIVGPVSATSGTHPNTAEARGTYSTTTVEDTSSATYAIAGLSLTKAASPTIYTLLGETISYTFTVTNSGSAVLDGPVTITDPLLAVTCPALTTVGDNNDFFDPGEQLVCTGNYTTSTTDVTNTRINNTAYASAGGVDSPTASTTVYLQGVPEQADLSVTKGDSPDPVAANSDLSYSIAVSNSGPDAASNVSWSDVLPAGTTFVSLSQPGGWTCSTPPVGAGGSVSCSLAVLASGGSASFTLVVHVPSNFSGVSPIINIVIITSDTNDNNSGNDTASTYTNVSTSADLSVTKTADDETPTVGDTVSYTITVSNAGPSDATNAMVTDTLGSGLTYVSSNASQGSYNSSTGLWTVGDLGAGSSATLTLNATVNASGSYGNTAAVVGSDQPDPSPVNNQIRIILSPGETTPEVTPPVIPPTGEPTAVVAVPTSLPITIADPMIAKDVSAPFAQPDGPISWTITVTNPNSVPIHNITVIDNLPPQAELVSATATAGSISTTGQTVTFSIQTLDGGQTVVITIEGRVRSDASGAVITNVASLTSAENPTPHTAQATVLRVTELPRTGETPWWRTPLLALAIGTLGLCGWMFVRRWIRTR